VKDPEEIGGGDPLPARTSIRGELRASSKIAPLRPLQLPFRFVLFRPWDSVREIGRIGGILPARYDNATRPVLTRLSPEAS